MPPEPEEVIAGAYQRVFQGEHGKTVLADLVSFCHVLESTAYFDEEGRMDVGGMAQLDGRRQVALRIYQMLGYTADDVPQVETRDEMLERHRSKPDEYTES